MARASVRRLLALLFVAAFVGPLQARARQEDASPRNQAPLTFLQLNDVYSTVVVDGLGGLARVATLKQRLSTPERTVLMVLGGAFLSPSVASSMFKGEQMVATLNAGGLDLATLGNHEFDFGTEVLIERMREATWQWVVSNVIDTRTGKPVGGAAPYVLRTIGALKVGFIGLCLTTSEISRDNVRHLRFDDPLEAAARYLPLLKQRGANVIVAVAHLSFAEDHALVRRFPEIDLVIGGHEHFPIAVTEGRTLISKAGFDARRVARIDVDRLAHRTVERFYELLPITSDIPDEPRTAAVIKSYEDRLSTGLDTVVATSRAPLDADTVRLRVSETNLGDLVADALRAGVGAELAIMNAGSIRGDLVYPPGPLTRRTLLAIHPFGNVVCKIAVPGRILLQALNSGVSLLPAAASRFPQVSNLRMRIDPRAPPGKRVSDVVVNGQPIDLAKTYTLALPDYVLKGGDDYTMFAGLPVLVAPEAGNLLVQALEKYAAAKGEITQEVEGRITVPR